MKIIAADIGGTSARFELVETSQLGAPLYATHYNSQAFENFDALMRVFIDDCGHSPDAIGMISLALPGIVNDTEARLTNLPWTINKQALQSVFGIADVHFMNDFQASALGTTMLEAHDLIQLNPGKTEPGGLRVAVGAGTGLGMAWLVDNQGVVSVYSTEAGHVDFAPVNQTQIALLQYLMKQFDHVSYERMLSGDGLVALYAFCAGKEIREVSADGVNASWVNAQASDQVSKNEIAQKAMCLFVEIFGAYIGNIAMILKPPGGIYITGGIAAKMLTWMQSDNFISSYLSKGRMKVLVEQIAVYLVTNERVGLLGSMKQALRMQEVAKL